MGRIIENFKKDWPQAYPIIIGVLWGLLLYWVLNNFDISHDKAWVQSAPFVLGCLASGAFFLAEWLPSDLARVNAFNFGILAPAMYIVAIWNVAPDADDLRFFNPSLMWFLPNFVLAIITYIIHLCRKRE
jgi:hypothetical protein